MLIDGIISHNSFILRLWWHKKVICASGKEFLIAAIAGATMIVSPKPAAAIQRMRLGLVLIFLKLARYVNFENGLMRRSLDFVRREKSFASDLFVMCLSNSPQNNTVNRFSLRVG